MTETQVVEYDVTDKAIGALSAEYMPLVINDLSDKKQLEAVHEARLDVKKVRVAVENKRKELKSEALAWGKKVDGEANRIKGLLEPIESHLQAEENKVAEEEARIKAVEDAKFKATIDDRIAKLQAVNHPSISFQEAAGLEECDFDDKLFHATENWEEAKRVREEQEEQREAETARLAKQKEDQDRREKLHQDLDDQRDWFDENIVDESNTVEELEKFLLVLTSKLDGLGTKDAAMLTLLGNQFKQAPGIIALRKEAAKVETDRKAIEDEKARIAKEATDKQAAEDARIKADSDAKEEAERKAREEADAEASRKRQGALEPDRDKIQAYIGSVREAVTLVDMPVIEDKAALLVITAIKALFDDFSTSAYEMLDEL